MAMRTGLVGLAGFTLICGGGSRAMAEQAAPVPPSPPPLFSEFFLVTRECKQAVVEIGSSAERPGAALVQTSEATDYLAGCQLAASGTVRCFFRNQDPARTFVSNSGKQVAEEYLQVGGESSFVVLLALNGNVMYINPASRDAVLISKQYADLSPAKDGTRFGAFAKTCKALYVSKDEFEELRASIQRKTPPSPPAARSK